MIMMNADYCSWGYMVVVVCNNVFGELVIFIRLDNILLFPVALQMSHSVASLGSKYMIVDLIWYDERLHDCRHDMIGWQVT